MKWIVWVLQGLLALGFIMFGAMKLSGNPDQVKAFTEIYKYGVGFMYVVGLIEVLAAVGLILGFWKPNVSLLSAGALVVVMAGAIVTHLIAGQGMGVAMMPLVLLVLTLIVFLGRRSLINRNTSISG